MPSPVSIVIPSWNGRHLLERFLPSVVAAAEWYAGHRASPVEIVVVDDGSTDGTAEWLAALSGHSSLREPRERSGASKLRIVRQPENRGFAEATNRGVAEAASPLVWLLNNDVEVDCDGLGPLADAFDEADATLFAVHSRMVDLSTGQTVGTGKMGGFARGFLRVHRSYIPVRGASGPFWSIFATGGSVVFRRAVFLELGGFDPIFAPFYFEDVELSYRAWKRGWNVRYEPTSTVRHQFSSTIAPLVAKGRIERISQRNRLLLHWIHLHDATWMGAHVLWLTVLLVTAPLTLRLDLIRGFIAAVKTLPDARRRRRIERGCAMRTDRQVLRIFEELDASGRIRSYGDVRELAADELSNDATPHVDPSIR